MASRLYGWSPELFRHCEPPYVVNLVSLSGFVVILLWLMIRSRFENCESVLSYVLKHRCQGGKHQMSAVIFLIVVCNDQWIVPVSERTMPLLPRTLLDLITTLRQSASLLRADQLVLRRTQMSTSDRMLRELIDARYRVAVCNSDSSLLCS